MLVLAVESATELAGVALADEAGVVATATLSRGRRHAETIAPAISFLCERAAIALGDLDGICVDIGPGLFTGLRVGISTAKALGFALDLPIATATSLEVLAHAVAGAGAGAKNGVSVVPVVDARRKEVFSARFVIEDAAGGGEGAGHAYSLEQVGGDSLTSAQELALTLEGLEAEGQPLVLVGDGALRYREVLRARTVSSDLASPPVEVLARLGESRLSAGEGVDPAEVRPSYLREADVRINWEQRLPPRSSGASEAGLPPRDAHEADLADASPVSGGRAG